MSGGGGKYINELLLNGYCPDDFKVELVEIGPLNDMRLLEKNYSKGTLFPNGLNGNTGNCVVWTDEHRIKMRKINKEAQNRPDVKARNSASKIGKPHSEERKSIESKAKMGDKNPMFGKSHSEETKQKLSDVLKGRTFSDEHKQKISDSHKNKIKTESHRKNLSESCKGKTNVFNRVTRKTAKVTIEEFESNRDIYLSVHSLEYRKIKLSINK